MAVGGLVVTYSDNPGHRAAARRLLEADARLELGPREGLRQAVVAETENARAGEALFEDLLQHPGIVAVDLAFVGGLDADAPRPEENER